MVPRQPETCVVLPCQPVITSAMQPMAG